MQGNGGHSRLLRDAFARYKQIILTHHVKFSDQSGARQAQYGIGRLIITVSSADETVSWIILSEPPLYYYYSLDRYLT